MSAKTDATLAAHKAMVIIMDGVDILRRHGWTVDVPPPKDRDVIVVEAGSTGVFVARWLTCAYFAEDGGDLWPCRPLAWREIPATPATTTTEGAE